MGSEDQVISVKNLGALHMIDLQERVGRILEGRGRVFQWRIVPGAGHQPFFVDRLVASWLERQLDFPGWTQDDIASMPEVFIRDWARDAGVDLGRVGRQDDRDAGTRALSLSIPSLSREQLTLFTLPEWEAQKDRLVMDVWVRQVLAQSKIAAH
jgi:hypothetical protein